MADKDNKQKNVKAYKVASILFYVAAAASYVAGIINLVKGNGFSGADFGCGCAFLCLGIVFGMQSKGKAQGQIEENKEDKDNK